MRGIGGGGQPFLAIFFVAEMQLGGGLWTSNS